jgi:hypothetical protein
MRRRRPLAGCTGGANRFEHLVRYGGWYSNRTRGKRRRMAAQPVEHATREVDAREAARVRSTWARLIHKVYEVDPLECPRCKGPMRVIALIDDAAVIRKILSHLGLWVPQHVPGREPGLPAPDPPGQSSSNGANCRNRTRTAQSPRPQSTLSSSSDFQSNARASRPSPK